MLHCSTFLGKSMSSPIRLWSIWIFLLVTTPIRAEWDHSVARSVVKIRGVDVNKHMFYGSGVVVQPDQVATNCHVVRDAIQIAVSRGAGLIPVTEEKTDVSRDICLLKAPGLKIPKAALGRLADLSPKAHVYFYGFPRALGMTFSEGEVSSLPMFGDYKIIETSAFFTLGGSGGRHVDTTGRLVGLATFLTPGHAGAYYAVPADWILKVNQEKPKSVRPIPGRSFWESQ